MATIECVPNISEGRKADVVKRIAEAAGGVAGVRLLDVQSDPTHHRSVITLAGERGPLRDGVLRLYAEAVAAIDLRTHKGEHPRLGAVDVCPFVPVEDVSMETCVDLARDVGQEVAASS